MGYFSYIASQAFKTDEQGRRLFCKGGIWSRPYIIPDAETEALLLKRHTSLQRWTLGPFILGQPFLFALWREWLFQPLGFLCYMVAVMLLFSFVGWIVHRRTVAPLERAEARLPLRRFYLGMAEKHSPELLVLGFIACLLFVAGGIWMVYRPTPPAFGASSLIGWTCIVIFTLAALAWGYALLLKLRGR